MDFDKIKGEYICLVEHRLEEILSARPQNEAIDKAMRYSLLGGGKRLRPILLLAASNPGNFRQVPQAALELACAVEMIHTYSLIHDDLPAMDDDALRRGRPTNHIVHGEGMAILAGDALLNLAYETMIGACLRYDDTRRTLEAAEEISIAAGTGGMIGGQVLDILSENKTEITTQELMEIHLRKTTAIIKASIGAGASLGEGAGSVERYRLAGQALGLSFQIMDDILDVVGEEAALGKPIGSDKRNNKHTYASLHGLELARKQHESLCEEAMDIFRGLGASFLCEYTNRLRTRVS